MKKYILIFLMLLIPTLSFATDYYATSSTVSVSSANLWVPTSTGSCAGSGTPLTWDAQVAGDVFHANGCTALAVGVDPQGTGAGNGKVTLTTVAGGGTAGGGFTYATATNITINADITAGTTTVLAISGSTGASNVIIGNITGGSAASASGISSTHTAQTITVTGNVTGGSNGTAFGITHAATTGSFNISGTCTPGSVAGASAINISSGASATVGTACKGSDSVNAIGCVIAGGGYITITGNIIHGKKGMAVSGYIYYAPGAATNYTLYPKDSSYVMGTVDSHATEMPSNPGIANVKSGTNYGTLQGTLSGGGGAWAF